MILNASMPSSAANVNAEKGVTPFIQIGLETGKSHWEMDINCPVKGILKTKTMLHRLLHFWALLSSP